MLIQMKTNRKLGTRKQNNAVSQLFYIMKEFCRSHFKIGLNLALCNSNEKINFVQLNYEHFLQSNRLKFEKNVYFQQKIAKMGDFGLSIFHRKLFELHVYKVDHLSFNIKRDSFGANGAKKLLD